MSDPPCDNRNKKIMNTSLTNTESDPNSQQQILTPQSGIAYPEPSPELIADIRKRLTEVPQEVLDRFHHALVHDPIQEPGSILWRAGFSLSSHELYEYRKTFFPPNSLVDPDTQGRPLLRDQSRNPEPST